MCYCFYEIFIIPVVAWTLKYFRVESRVFNIFWHLKCTLLCPQIRMSKLSIRPKYKYIYFFFVIVTLLIEIISRIKSNRRIKKNVQIYFNKVGHFVYSVYGYTIRHGYYIDRTLQHVYLCCVAYIVKLLYLPYRCTVFAVHLSTTATM